MRRHRTELCERITAGDKDCTASAHRRRKGGTEVIFPQDLDKIPKHRRGTQELWFFVIITVIFFLSFVAVFLFVP